MKHTKYIVLDEQSIAYPNIHLVFGYSDTKEEALQQPDLIKPSNPKGYLCALTILEEVKYTKEFLHQYHTRRIQEAEEYLKEEGTL